MEIITRRPSTIKDLSLSLGIGMSELREIIKNLKKKDKIEQIVIHKNDFFRVKR
jgi:hypothetical protein